MDLSRIILRMALWLRRPPSLQRLIIIGAVVLIGLAIAAIERIGYWPDALTTDGSRPLIFPRF